MESIGIALAMLAAVLLSGMLVRLIAIPIPMPLIQIGLGIIIAGVFEKGVTLSPDVFFLLFLPPLLYLDAWRIPKDALQRDLGSIVMLALGLVLLTVVGLGYVLHWLIPTMPLAVGFALAAIISPTDAVAVGGIGRKFGIPPRVMSILEGEALFNDASGLVAFRLAVAAAATGTLELAAAAGSFLWVGLAGLAAGALAAWLITFTHNHFTARFGEEPGTEILLSLLVPFAAYFLAEAIEASGILAAVAAGLVMSYGEMSGRASAFTRIRRRSVWDMIQFTLNGIVFVLLGEQLPRIFQGAATAVEQSGHHNPAWLAVYAVVVCLCLALLRFGWIYACVRAARLARHSAAPPPSLRMLLLLSVGGVRGAVTLAGVMTLPLTLPSGEAFPARDLAIFLAACVIIISLVMASIGLPWLLRGAPGTRSTPSSYQEQRRLAQSVAYTAVQAVLQKTIGQVDETTDLQALQRREQSITRIQASLESTLAVSADIENRDAHLAQQQEIALHRAALDAARNAIYQLARQGRISDAVARDMVRRLDLDELRL